jgi:TctA family transporter
MLLAFILGPLMEEYLRRAMPPRGDPWVCPAAVSATLLVLAVLAMCPVLFPPSTKRADLKSD